MHPKGIVAFAEACFDQMKSGPTLSLSNHLRDPTIPGGWAGERAGP